MATYTVTNTFAADTTAVASEVNQNFTDVLTALNAFDASNLSSGTVPIARISGLTVTQLAAATIVLEAEGIGNNDNDTTWPTSAAVKDYVDTITNTSSDAMHDAEGGYNNCDINGTKTKVYTKYFTGTTDNDNQTLVAHGITGVANILHVSAAILNSSTTRREVSSHRTAHDSANQFEIHYTATNVGLQDVGSNLQGQSYVIKIDYKI